MCEIDGTDVGGSTSTRVTFLLSMLLPSALGPPSTTSPTLTSERRYELLWLTSLPSRLSLLPLLPPSLPDPPSRLGLPPGSLLFNFLNGFEKDFRKSMSVLGRCRSWRVRWADEVVVSIQDRPASGAQKMLYMVIPLRFPLAPVHAYGRSLVMHHD